MASINHVLAAVDLTPMGRRVAERGRILAEAHDARLTLVHVVDPLADVFMDDVHAMTLVAGSQDAATKLADWVQGRTTAPVELVVPAGNAVREVAKLAKNADVVLAGSSSIDAARVGPVTRRLARKARVGVVTVRRQPRVPYRRVLAAVDLSDSSREAVDLALRLAPDAEIVATYALVGRFDRVLAASGMAEEEISAMTKARTNAAEEAVAEFVKPWPTVRSTVVSGPPSEALNEEVRRRNVDLVTVANKGGAGDAMVLLGTVAEEVMESAPCDVAIARVKGVFRRP